MSKQFLMNRIKQLMKVYQTHVRAEIIKTSYEVGYHEFYKKGFHAPLEKFFMVRVFTRPKENFQKIFMLGFPRVLNHEKNEEVFFFGRVENLFITMSHRP